MTAARARVPAVALSLVACIACMPEPAPTVGADPAWVESVETFRRDREERLRSPDGWLTLVGLAWLEAGENRVGSDPSLEVVLPAGSVPARVGTITLDGSVATWTPEPGLDPMAVTLDGEPAGSRPLADDLEGEPDRLQAGRITFHVIRRGDRLAVRIKDPESATRIGFAGIETYAIDPAYRVEARLEAYDPPREVEVDAVTGGVQPYVVPGLLRFELNGAEQSLEPFLSGEPGEADATARLFILFKDATSGRETYGAGRYLYADLDRASGVATLDFNLAYTPPCAFTSFATCPLPPPGNRLDAPVRAGERFEPDRAGTHR